MPPPSPNALASSPSPAAPERAEVLDVIRKIARTELEYAGLVDEETGLTRDLALDSMTVVIVAVGLEDRFRIRLDEADAQALDTVGDLISLVQRRAKEQHACD